MPSELPRHTTKHPRTLVRVALVVVLAAVLGVGVAFAVRHGEGSATAPSPVASSPQPSPPQPRPPTSTTPAPDPLTGAPTPDSTTLPAPPPAPAPEQPVGVATAPPVDVGAPAVLADGVTATVRTITQVRTVPQGAGDRAGPGVVVRLAVRNGSGADVDLSTLTVTATAAGAPAPPSQGGVATPMAGPLAAGAEASGTYVFRTAADGAAPLLVQVSLAGSPDVAVIQQG